MRLRCLLLTCVASALLSTTALGVVITPTGITYTGTGVEDVFPDEIRLIDGSGLSGPIDPSGINLPAVTHGSPSAATAWVTNAPGGGGSDYFASAGGATITFDVEFGDTLNLTDFVYWGYGFGATNGNSISSVRLDFSTDGGNSIDSSQTIPVPLVFGPPAVVPFTPTDANFVTLEVLDNHFGSTGSNGGGDRVGLAEIRFIDSVEEGAVTLQINRDNGEAVLDNATFSPISFAGLGMTSAAGALNPSNWTPIAGNYDAVSNGGDASISGDEWLVFEAENDDLSEGTLGTGTLAAGESINLGAGTWVQNPTEDVQVTYLDANTGEVVPVFVEFTGTTLTDQILVGDLNFDGNVDALDWPIYRDNYRADLSGLSTAEAYQLGDLNGDGVNNAVDFGILKSAFEANNPATSFASVIAGSTVPEPSALAMSALAAVGLLCVRRRTRRTGVTMNTQQLAFDSQPSSFAEIVRALTVPIVQRSSRYMVALRAAAALAVLAIFASTSQAVLVAHYEFDDPGNIGLDSAGGDNDGTALGSDVSSALGRVGAGSLSLDASGVGLELANPGTFQPLTTFTIASFINPDFDGGNWGNVGATGRIFGALGIDADETQFGTNSGYGFGVATTGNQLYTTFGIQDYQQPAGVVQDEWQHIAVVVNEGDATYYLDGTNIGTVTGGNPTATTNPFHIGAAGFFNSDRFHGLIDDLRVYDNALSDSEILGLASVEAPTLKLQVDPADGDVQILNGEGFAFGIDQYEILSDAGSLNAAGWSSIQVSGRNGLPQGDGSGNGWEELGTPAANFVGEAYFQGSSDIASSESLYLGQLFDTGVATQDLEFVFRSSDGTLLAGAVEYVNVDAPVGVAGDYNGNGVVDAADYTVWRNNLGGSSLPNEGGISPGIVDAADYAFWRSRYGATAGSGSVDAIAVPEPSSVAFLLAAIGGLVFSQRRIRTGGFMFGSTSSSHMLLFAATSIAAWAIAGNAAQADVYNDRVYLFGDPDSFAGLEGASDGAVIGSMNTNPLGSNLTIDSGPDLGNSSGTRLQLEQTGGAVYKNVSSSGGGLNRPGATAGDFGVMFDGVNDRLTAVPVNRPDEMAAIVATLPGAPVYPINYTNITTRGLQMWVYPEQAGINAGDYQSIIFDTHFSGGPALTADGQWTQSNSFHVDGAEGIAPVPVEEDAPVVAGDQWYHVMHHNYPADDPNGPALVPGSGTERPFDSVMYVNGVAVSANNDNVSLGGSATYTRELVVGAAQLQGDGTTPVYGLYFDGTIDDLEMYVYGDNTADGGTDYGSFDLFSDNAWIADQIATDPDLPGTLTPGDANKDGSVNGDGSGSPSSDDVAAFIAGWGSRNVFQGNHSQLTVGDWLTWEDGDFNLDGVTDFADWFILRSNHENPASLNLSALLSGGGVPEPSSFALIAALFGVAAASRRRDVS